jgi:hypothetical protein
MLEQNCTCLREQEDALSPYRVFSGLIMDLSGKRLNQAMRKRCVLDQVSGVVSLSRAAGSWVSHRR